MSIGKTVQLNDLRYVFAQRKELLRPASEAVLACRLEEVVWRAEPA
jgi:hypothetical protein